jgi:uncharacterized protein HemX
MTESTLVYALIAVTFALAIVFGVVQWNKAKKARNNHEHSVAERQEGAAATPQSQPTQRSKEFS